jgi:3',5'-cyclic-AMP phosphodiesterase
MKQDNFRGIIFFASLLVITFLLFSCEQVFDYSIYSAKVDTKDKDIRKTNFEKLKPLQDNMTDTSSFSIALLSDSHTYYDELSSTVDQINTEKGISFVLHGGDMTDGGILAEYRLFRTIINKLNRPYFTVIGNHDCLANGKKIYNEMFGQDNYTLEFAGCKFIFFNDVVWETHYTEPDFGWLAEQLLSKDEFRHVFVVAHIPPWDDQFTPLYSMAYETMLDSAKVDLSIHGHMHSFNYPANGNAKNPEYLIIGSPSKHAYVRIDIKQDTIIVNKIDF